MHQVAGLVVQSAQRLADRDPGIEPICDRFLFGDNAFQLTKAPVIGLVEVDGGAEVLPRQQPVRVAAERVLTPSVRCDLVAQHHGERAVGVGRRGGALVQFSMQRSVSRRRLGHHVHKQLLNLAGLVDATRHLPGRGRTPGRRR